MNPLDRKLRILSAIVEKYISTGDPVGSKTICEDFDLALSPATIRSEMANLVSAGYLIQPHISSGRVPSHRGYRVYINRLMPEFPLAIEEKNLVQGVLGTSAIDPESLLECATEVLADMTGFTAVMTTPLNQASRIREIKLVKISRRGAMLVLVTSNGMVKNKLFRCEFDLNEQILKMFEEILEEEFRGRLLGKLNPESVNIIVSSDEKLSSLLLPIVDTLLEAAKEASEVKIKVYGQKNLLLFPDITAEAVVDVFNFLEDSDKLLKLLKGNGCGVNFLVGEENAYKQLKNLSVASTRYNIAGKFGILGIIGPTRMNYSLISTYLKYIASLVEMFLERILKGE